METKEIIKIIEELDEIQLNDVIKAVCRTYNRVNQENILAVVALPKNDTKKRKQVIQWLGEMMEKDATI